MPKEQRKSMVVSFRRNKKDLELCQQKRFGTAPIIDVLN